MDAPASKPREDSPASGPSPDGQVPGKLDLCARLAHELKLLADTEPIPADDEQVEGAA